MSRSLTRIVRLMAVASALLASAAFVPAYGQTKAPSPDIPFFPPGGVEWAVGTDGTVIAALCGEGVAVYARTGASPTWVLQDVAPMIPDGNMSSVAVDRERIVAGEWFALGFPNGVAQVFRRSGSDWIEEAVLTPQTGFPNGEFGFAADIDGDTLAIGAPYDGPAGAVYVFTREGDQWSQRARLVPGDSIPDGLFGGAVGLSDGVLVVGAQSANAAYVFAGNGADWTQQAKLSGPVGGFGYSVAADGDTVIAGAPTTDTAFSVRAGAAYVFVREGTSWSLQGELASPSGETDDLAGFSVALSGDRAVSGAPWDSHGFGEPFAGAVQRYTRNGGVWSYSGASGSPLGSLVGGAVAIGADSMVAVAPGSDTLHVFLDVPIYVDMPTWLDLGYGLAGVDGIPRLIGSGTLQAGSPGQLLLEHAAPSSLVLGLLSPAQAPTPFKGGTLVPLPPQISLPSFTTGGGIWRAQWSTFPALPFNTPFYVQFAVADPAAPNGVAMSNAVAGISH